MSLEIEEQSKQNDYVTVDVNSDVVDGLSAFNPVGLNQQFASSRPPLPPHNGWGR